MVPGFRLFEALVKDQKIGLYQLLQTLVTIQTNDVSGPFLRSHYHNTW